MGCEDYHDHDSPKQADGNSEDRLTVVGRHVAVSIQVSFSGLPGSVPFLGIYEGEFGDIADYLGSVTLPHFHVERIRACNTLLSDKGWPRLKKLEIILLAEALQLQVPRSIKRQPLIDRIVALQLHEEEIGECWEAVDRKQNERRQELDLKMEEIERKKPELERPGLPRTVGSGNPESFKMNKLVQPFKLGEDINLFLVKFDRTCEKTSLEQSSWSQTLPILLPCEATEMMVRLSMEDADDYVKVKTSLLRKYRLSAEAFRQPEICVKRLVKSSPSLRTICGLI